MDRERPRQQLTLEERYLDIHEAAQILDVSEGEMWDLVHKHEVPTHNIAGAFVRFKKEDIEKLKIKWRIERELFPKTSPFFPHNRTFSGTTRTETLKDFWYFNDFYVICTFVIAVLLYFIISSQ